jgi:hypothetical protein
MLPLLLLLVRRLGHATAPFCRFGQWAEPTGEAWAAVWALLWQAAAPVGRSPGPDQAQHCARFLKLFLFYLNSRKQFKLLKFVETCRNVQKCKTKFCWTPLGQLFTVGLTNFIFVQYFIVQNYKNSNTKINVHKYLYLQIF